MKIIILIITILLLIIITGLTLIIMKIGLTTIKGIIKEGLQ